MIKRILTVICLLFMSVSFAEGDLPSANSNTPVYQNIQYEDCTKIYNTDKEKLYFLTIGAVNSNKYKLEELQTDNGYIIFSVGKSKYLLTIAGIDNNNSILKITPCNNLYYFQPEIITNIYKYIDLNKDIELK